MKVIADFCLIPIGVGVSVSTYVAACQKVLDKSGLTYKMHSYGTNVEGEWEAVLAAVKKCHETVHQMGATRISTSMRIGTRTDREQSMDDKIKSVEEKMS